MKKLLSALLGIFGLFIVPAYAALPSGYTQLEYIESTGTQYIDTGVIVDDMTYVFKSDFATTVHDTNVIFGTMNVSEGYPGIVVNASGSFRYGTQQIASSVDFAVGTKYSIELLYQNLKVDGTNYAASGTTNNTALTYPMFLFARNNVGTAGNFASVKMYSWQMYDNGTLKRDFVPAKNASGKIGMYDTVNDVFYENKGSGEFIAGDPVVSSNICNLFDISQSPTTENISSNFIWTRYNINVSSTSLSVGNWTAKHTDFISPGTYTITFNGTNSSVAIRGYDGSNLSVLRRGNGSFTITNPTQIWIFVADPETMARITEIMLEQGSTATPYVPYNPSCGCDGTIVNYTSATGTGVQSGTPTPTNPIEPTFYKQGNMILRKVGDVADSYDATTGKITRRVGVKVFDGTENWGMQSINDHGIINFQLTRPSDWAYPLEEILTSHFRQTTEGIAQTTEPGITVGANLYVRMFANVYDTVEKYKQWLAQQYAAGTPVTVWYPLATETTEYWPASYCETPIKIATTKYNESAFSPLNTALANAISVVDTVVTQTITQAGRIATLQTQKQTRPADDTCPAYKQCLLVEDENGKPHWYEITDPFRDFVAPIIAKEISPNDTVAFFDAGYTELEYIESTGTQYIDTGVQATGDLDIKTRFKIISYGSLFGVRDVATGASNKAVWVAALNERTIWLYNNKTTHNRLEKLNLDQWYDADINKGVLSFNGNEVASYETENFTGSDIFLFNTNEANGTLASGASVQISYFKIYDASGTLVRNFIPVRENEYGIIGMYDTVSGTFFTNSGTGSFVAGPAVQKQNSDVPVPQWRRAWDANAQYNLSAGEVYGTAQCNNLSGTQEHAQKATNAQTASSGWLENGAKCWCKVVGVELDNEYIEAPATASWVFDAVRPSVKDCNKMCAAACSNRVLGEAAFRKALFGM